MTTTIEIILRELPSFLSFLLFFIARPIKPAVQRRVVMLSLRLWIAGSVAADELRSLHFAGAEEEESETRRGYVRV